MLEGRRPLERISIFHPEVGVPSWTTPYQALPDDLLGYFATVIHNDTRGVFPVELLRNIRWQTCPTCGMEHARRRCPSCASQLSPKVIVRKPRVKEVVTAKSGQIIAATTFGPAGELHWLTWEKDQQQLLRNGKVFLPNKVSSLPSDMQVCWKGSNMIALGRPAEGMILCLNQIGQAEALRGVDRVCEQLAFDADDANVYWRCGDVLYSKIFGQSAQIIGKIEDGSLLWVGPEFGFGYTPAIDTPFTFDRRTVRRIQQWKGKDQNTLVRAECLFGEGVAWFLTSRRKGGVTYNTVSVFTGTSHIASLTEPAGTGCWLGSVTGKSALRNMLFCPSDYGLFRLDVNGTQVDVARVYPGTASIVSSRSQVVVSPSSHIFVVDVHRKAISLLQL